MLASGAYRRSPSVALFAVLALDGTVRAAASPRTDQLPDDLMRTVLCPPGQQVTSPPLLKVLAAARAGSPAGAVRCDVALDGHSTVVDLTWALLHDEDGTPHGVAVGACPPQPDTEREQQDFFHALSLRATDLALVGDAHAQLLYVSPAVRHMLGYHEDDVVDSIGWDFVHPDDVDSASAVYQSVVHNGGTKTFTLRVRGVDGSWSWMQATATNLLDSPIGGVVCNVRDVTERMADGLALRRSERWHRTIADTAQEGIWAVTPAGRTLYANARMAEVLGVDLPVLYERTVTDLLRPEQVPEMQQRLRERAARGAERYELDYGHPDGRQLRLLISAGPLYDEDGQPEGSLAMVSDVTAARRAEAELQRAALHDALTGLPNRTVLLDRLEHALSRESVGTGVLVVDLDQFKLVNDSRGHDVGDAVLVAAAERLRQARPASTVARFGGDSFVVVCEDVDEQQALRAAEDLLARFAEPFEIDGQVMPVGVSIGVAMSPGRAGDLLRYADSAMHAAKGAGRGQVRRYDRALSEEVEQRYTVARELRRALPSGELEMHYQPIVALDDGRVLGVEALARWTSPVLGAVPPSRFAPVAELTGLGPELDAFAVRTCLADVAALRASSALPVAAYVAVNVAARSLGDCGLEQLLLDACRSTGTPPQRVVVEITEGAIVDDAQRDSGVLGRLREHGFSIAIDDFGTGYSSLAYLRDLPITGLKVDRSFVAGIQHDPDAVAIVASIIDLANAVGLDVVAEGIETAEQAALLRELGCAAGQGWLWSPALPPDAVAKARWREGFAPRLDRDPAPPRGRGAQPVGVEHGRDRLLALHAQGASLATIAAALNSEGFRTPGGVRWHRNSVARAVAAAAYPQLAPRE